MALFTESEMFLGPIPDFWKHSRAPDVKCLWNGFHLIIHVVIIARIFDLS